MSGSQLRDGRDVRWAGIELVALIGVLLRQADDIEQVLSNLFRVRRWLPLFAPALPQIPRPNQEFQTVRSDGGLLPPDLLRRLLDRHSSLVGIRAPRLSKGSTALASL